jgi:hypothetical protein
MLGYVTFCYVMICYVLLSSGMYVCMYGNVMLSYVM